MADCIIRFGVIYICFAIYINFILKKIKRFKAIKIKEKIFQIELICNNKTC